MQSPDIKRVEILKDYKLIITFSNEEIRLFDIEPYLKYPVFKALNEENELRMFSIVDGTIEWKCGAELSADTFYLGSSSIDKSEHYFK